MIPSRSPIPPALAKAGGLAAALLLPISTLYGQSLPNPDFETDPFSGTVAVNGDISGWTTTTPTLVGLNQFGNNGTAPGGGYAFIQAGGDLTTTVSGLAIGTKYHVSYRVNAATGTAPYMRFSIDSGDAASAAIKSSKINAVGGTAPYRLIAYDFVATEESHQLTLTNSRASGSHQLVIDAFEVTASDSTWAFRPWTGDVDSGIDSQYAYSHAISLGGSTAVKVNDVSFASAGTTNIQVQNNLGTAQAQASETNVPGRVVMTGAGVNASFSSMNVTGSSLTLARNFTAGNLSFTLSNLKPNTPYVATFFGAGWDATGTEDQYRAATFTVSTAPQKATVDLNAYGHLSGIAVDCHYVSDANGEVTISMTSTAANQFHTSAFSNRETEVDDGSTHWVHREWSDDASSGIEGHYRYTHAYNFGISEPILVDGVFFRGLTGNNPVAEGFTSHRLNGAGVVLDSATLVTGESAALTSFFHWAYTPNVMTLSGLTPGTRYVFTFYSVGWEGTPRELLFTGTAGGKTMQVNQNIYGIDHGICMEYTYVAPDSGRVVISASGFGTNSAPHNYAISNREADPMTDVAPYVTLQPAGATIASSKPYTFRIGAQGSDVLSYQWTLNGNPIPGATEPTYAIAAVSSTDAGWYSCTISNSAAPGGVTSEEAELIVSDQIPGFFDSGTGWNRQLLPDGAIDPHYVFAANPHQAGSQTVYVSSAHPAWAQPNATSKWIAPVSSHNTSAASAVNPNYYVYRTHFYLAGFDPSTVSITGKWASDNLGAVIRVNGVPVGFPNTTGNTFANFVSFTIDSTVLANSGAVLHTDQPNTLDFVVSNEAAGSTGLLVRDLQGIGIVAPGTAPVISVHPASSSAEIGGTVTLGVLASGSGPLTYQWSRNGEPVGEPILQPYLTIALNSSSDFGSYTVTVSNPADPVGVTSQAALVSLPTLPPYLVTTAKNTPLSIDTLDILWQMGSSYQFGSYDSTSEKGGSVSLDGGGYLIYTPPAGFAGADSFAYTLVSPSGEHPGVVQIEVTGVPDDVTPGEVALLRDAGSGTVTASFIGTPGASYTLERSTTLETGSWEEVQTLTAPPGGEVMLTDAAAPEDRAFYRIVY